MIAVDRDEGQRRVKGIATNRGKGTAYEVSFERENAGLMGVISRQTAERAEFGTRLEVGFVFDRDAHGDGVFVLKWRQEPRLHRVRTKRVRFKLEAIPDPNSRRGQRKR